jgi:hypothetical protein
VDLLPPSAAPQIRSDLRRPRIPFALKKPGIPGT